MSGRPSHGTLSSGGGGGSLALKAPTIHRIDGYDMTHRLGEIRIDLMWHQTRLDRSGQSCALIHDFEKGAQREMLIAQQRTVRLLVIGCPMSPMGAERRRFPEMRPGDPGREAA